MKSNDWFFDRFEKQIDNHPVRTIGLAWLGMALFSLLFWAAIIAMVVFGLSFIL